MATESCDDICLDDMACIPPSSTHLGKAPMVLDEFGCIAQLVMLNEADYPAIEQAISDSRVELRNGSAKYPIALPHLQKQVGGSFKRMMVQDASGKWYAFTAAVGCVNKRLIIVNGTFTFVDDILPEFLEMDICQISSSSEFEFFVGANTVSIECPDGTTKQYLKWVLVPKNLVP